MFRVEGSWPSPVSIRQGWGRAVARPWNDESADAFLRLERGRSDFLETATRKITSISGGGVFSPAMFPNSTRVWTRAGYEQIRQLEVLERSLRVRVAQPTRKVRRNPRPEWDRLLEIDRAAFAGFWRMSLDGLSEALSSTNLSTVLTIATDDVVFGYAIVGSQWGTSYLQRVAVDPVQGGKGLGTDLVRAAVKWARETTATSMVLNVRAENARAIRLYEREGFTNTGSKLLILRYGTTTLLN